MSAPGGAVGSSPGGAVRRPSKGGGSPAEPGDPVESVTRKIMKDSLGRQSRARSS